MTRLVFRNPKGLLISLNRLNLTVGAIFAYILKVRDFDLEYVGPIKIRRHILIGNLASLILYLEKNIMPYLYMQVLEVHSPHLSTISYGF